MSGYAICWQFFETRDIPAQETRLKGKPGEKTAKDRKIHCLACRHIITSPEQEISVNGGHQQTFTNPAGITFNIGLFREATGCCHFGQATEEFTWFPGYAWRMAGCGKCGTHLGWQYTGPRGDCFYGLILDRITETQ